MQDSPQHRTSSQTAPAPPSAEAPQASWQQAHPPSVQARVPLQGAAPGPSLDFGHKPWWYLFPVMQLLSLSLPFFVLSLGGAGGERLLLLAPMILVALLNAVWALVHTAPRCDAYLTASLVMVKYLAIPFYLALFVFGLFPSMAFAPIFGPLDAMGAFIVDYLLFLSFVPWGIAYLVCQRRSGRIGLPFALLNALLQFCYVLDVIDVMCLVSIGRRRFIASTVAVLSFVIVSFAGLYGFFFLGSIAA